MSEMTESALGVPSLTLGWRLQMALRHGDVSVQEMADQLGVRRQTLSRWTGDHGAPPKRAYIAQWALATGVPLEWLETGVSTSVSPDGGPMTTREYDAEMLPFPGLVGTRFGWGSHDTPQVSWQEGATACRASGSTEPRNAPRLCNEASASEIRATSVNEPSVADISVAAKVAA